MWAGGKADAGARAFICDRARALDDCFHCVTGLLPPPTALRVEMRGLLSAVGAAGAAGA